MPQTPPPTNFDQIRLWTTLGIAVIALVQPWLIALWKRYFRPGRIDICETANIEIGYANFGPTLCLQGTLRARHRDLFVQRIELELVRERDGSSHSFQWLAFRSPSLDPAGAPKSVEAAASFMISADSPRTFLIVFNDQRRLEEMRRAVDPVSTVWRQAIAEYIGAAGGSGGDGQAADTPLPPWEVASPRAYRTVSQGPEHLTAWAELGRLCYWEAGDYRVTMKVHASEPSGVFSKSWRFTLTEQYAETLRLNVVAILMEICEQPRRYGFGFAPYIPIPAT